MPAGSEPSRRPAPAPVDVPHTFRPLGVRVAVVVFGLLLFGVAAVIWVAFPESVREAFTLFQRITLVFFGLCYAAAGYALARSRVDARADGVVVVNGFRTRRYEWAEVLQVTLRAGSPWAVLDLADGTSVSAMGIQGSDGNRAVRQIRQLRTLVDRFTRTERDD